MIHFPWGSEIKWVFLTPPEIENPAFTRQGSQVRTLHRPPKWNPRKSLICEGFFFVALDFQAAFEALRLCGVDRGVNRGAN